ncbi:hypothetical protein HZC31_07535 [Candidatus Woesearchaeota archaeon]|nr:hypothetical protein [Candidatus Woesearchaeota archaeon]
MALKNRTAADAVNNERVYGTAKARSALVDANQAARGQGRGKMQQGMTVDGRKTGIVRRK